MTEFVPERWSKEMLHALNDAGRPLFVALIPPAPERPPRVLGPALHVEDLPTAQPAVVAVRSWGTWECWVLEDYGELRWCEAGRDDPDTMTPDELASFVSERADEW